VGIYVLDGGIRDAGWKKLAKSLLKTGRKHELVRLKPAMGQFDGLPMDWGGSVMTYARLALADLVDEDKVFYIDSDLVMNRDWSPVWEWDLDGSVVAAARDVIVQTLGKECLPLQDFGMDPDGAYLQAGVMLMDLRRWREKRISGQVMEYLRSYPHHQKYWDQSALNVVLYRQWKKLPDEWNVPAHWADQGRHGFDLQAPVVHFAGPHKPWIYGHHCSESSRSFFRILDQTSWSGWRPSALRQSFKWLKYRAWQVANRVKRVAISGGNSISKSAKCGELEGRS
jgi:lipopolysaccharide biosynthesis glycosyltransferase